MLRELTKLAGGILFLHGHVTDVEAARLLARAAETPPAPLSGGGGHKQGGADWRTLLQLLLLAAIWGGSFLLLRVAAPTFGPIPLVEVRLALGALVLSRFLWRARVQLAAAGWRKIAAIALVNTLFPFLLFAWSAERAPAGVSAIVNSMAVPFAAVAAFAMFGESIRGRRLAGLLMGLVGVVVLAGGDMAGVGLGPAVAAGALAALLYGVSANLVKRYFAGLPPAAVAAATLASNALVLAPFAAWTWPSVHISVLDWLSLATLGVVCTGIAYGVYFGLIQRVGAPRATMVTYLVPVFGVLWAWLALDEPLTINMAVGGALILSGMLLGQLQRRGFTVRRHAVARVSARPCTNCHG